MNKNIKLIFVTIFLLPLSYVSSFTIGDIPIQDEGRIKPLDTYARNHLLAFYGKRSISKINLSATDWLLNLVLDPEAGKNLKIFNIRNPEVVSSIFLDWSTDHKYSFNQILPGLRNQAALLSIIDEKPNNQRTTFEKQLIELSSNAMRFEEISYLKSLRLIPPNIGTEDEEWISPLEFILNGLNPDNYQNKILNSLQQYLAARMENDESAMTSSLVVYESALKNIPKNLFNIDTLKKETWLNQVNLFYISLGFYLFAFLMLGFSWMSNPNTLRKLSFLSLIIGFFAHGYGIILRMIIMSRPPVSTLYESVLFVSFIVILFALILEYFRKDGLGIFVGAVGGTIFHFIGFNYASDGDTLNMLVAVLNSNFWLATHVTTITMGYGASLVAGFIGHLYLVQSIREPSNTAYLKSVYNNMFGVTLVALFFTLFGTILGGIWADQSWGRFWGWDPKENGALLIVLWQLMMIHMRLSGLAKAQDFALGMSLNNIIVAMAWFGVNLLQVGLHSYGFDDGVAKNLFIFIGAELLFSFGMYYWSKKKSKRSISI